MALIVELLDVSVHVRTVFHSGIPEIDIFLKERANKEHELSISDTYVIVEDHNKRTILGYFTLSLSSIDLNALPSNFSKKLPRYPYIGAVLLGRMCRDLSHSPKGFGSILLKEALKESLTRGTFYALVVHAKETTDNKLIEYYKKFGFTQLITNKHHLFMPHKEIMQLIT